jgi:hypothetical protein
MNQSAAHRRWPTALALLLLIVGAAWGVWSAAQTINQHAHLPPDFDEAVHLLPVRQLAVDAAQGDWAAFLRHTLNQDQLAAYPFFHSWLTFPAWLLAPGIATARLMSAIYLALAGLVAFGLGYDLGRNGRFPWLGGFVAGALTLLSLPLWAYAGLAYLEAAGLLTILLALWLYGRSDPSAAHARRYALLTSLAVAAAFFTKYNFGLFLIGGIALNEFVAWGLARRGDWAKRWLVLGGPTAVLALLWFLWPGHLTRFLYFGGAQEGGLTIWRLASWLYYPRSLFSQYSAGLPIALLVAAGLLYGLWRWRDFRSRSLLAYLLAGWLMLLIVPQKEPRFLYTVAPAAFVLTGGWVAATAVWFTHQSQRRQIGLAVLGLIWLVWAGTAVQSRFQFFDLTLAAGYASSPETAEAYHWVQEQTLAQSQPVHILNDWHLFSAPALLWSYYAANPASPLAYDDGFVSATLVAEPTPENQAALLADLRARGVRTILSIDGSPSGDYSGWAMLEPLLASGAATPIASSPPITLPLRSLAYQEALYSGEFRDRETAVAHTPQETLTLRLHLYQIGGW